MISKIEEIRQTDPCKYQNIMNSIESFVRECASIEADALSILMDNGMLTSFEAFKEAIKIKEARDKAIKQEKERNLKASEQQRKEALKPDNKFWRVWRNRDYDPEGFNNYIKNTSTEELAEYLAKMRKNPMHYNSMFKEPMPDVINALETLILGKEDNNPRQPPTPEKRLNYAT